MNKKLERHKAEREKNRQKISKLEARNAELDKLIRAEENTEIVALVHNANLDSVGLAELLTKLQENNGVPIHNENAEDDAYEE